MTWVVLSPHFDDAVLSCGGWIAAQRRGGEVVRVWTVMAGLPKADDLSPLAAAVHSDWPSAAPREMVIRRRQEDREALSRLGAEVRFLPWADCIYRQGPAGEWLYADLFTRPAPADAPLVDGLRRRLEALPAEVRVLAPLAVGGHVDHRLVRQAAEQAARPCWYYADLPYALRHPDSLEAATAGMSALRLPLREEEVSHWLAAAAAYRSQMAALFGSPEAMRRELRAWAGDPPQISLYHRP